MNYVPNATAEIKQLKCLIAPQTGLSKKDKKFYQEKIEFHQKNAGRIYRDAKNKCWCLPDYQVETS